MVSRKVMSNAQALSEARKRWKDAAVEDNRRPSSQVMRDAAREKLLSLRATLSEDEKRERRKELRQLQSDAMYKRYSVGDLSFDLGPLGRVFSIHGQGDSWEEAFKSADDRGHGK